VSKTLPCVVTGSTPCTNVPYEPFETFCSAIGGIASGNVCCPKSCGTCGGAGCSTRPGRGSACCTGKVSTAGKSCLVTAAAPCVRNCDESKTFSQFAPAFNPGSCRDPKVFLVKFLLPFFKDFVKGEAGCGSGRFGVFSGLVKEFIERCQIDLNLPLGSVTIYAGFTTNVCVGVSVSTTAGIAF